MSSLFLKSQSEIAKGGQPKCKEALAGRENLSRTAKVLGLGGLGNDIFVPTGS